jgi:lysophospholipase L1-like esterase
MAHLHRLHRSHRLCRPAALLLAALAAAAATAQAQTGSIAPPLAPASGPASTAQVPSAADIDARWYDSFAAFAAADQLKPPQPGGVVFVGSSSIRLWAGLEAAFADVAPVLVQRGFGGSRLADCVRYVGRLVLPYKPHTVVLYAGENDLEEGQSPQQVLQSFGAFVAQVNKALPATRIVFVSIKPSPLRLRILPQVRETNALVAAAVRGRTGLDYVDVHSAMVDASGQPRSELFQPDQLHMNASGYALWRSAIGAALR